MHSSGVRRNVTGKRQVHARMRLPRNGPCDASQSFRTWPFVWHFLPMGVTFTSPARYRFGVADHRDPGPRERSHRPLSDRFSSLPPISASDADPGRSLPRIRPFLQRRAHWIPAGPVCMGGDRLDEQSRAELLTWLVVNQLVALMRSGSWLRTEHVIESCLIWQRLNGATCEWIERARLVAASQEIAGQISWQSFPNNQADRASLFNLNAGWVLDYSSETIRHIHTLCAEYLRWR
jgi:hypothetical protein